MNHDDTTASSSSSARARMDPDEARLIREEKARQKEIDAGFAAAAAEASPGGAPGSSTGGER